MQKKDSEKIPLCGRGMPPFRKTGTVTFPSLENDVDTDILIIGGGAAGLLCAYALTEKGKTPILCEMNGIAGCSTAFAPPYLLPYADASMRSLARKYGHGEAVATFKELTDTLADLKEIVYAIGGNCGFTVRDAFIFTDTLATEDAVDKEYRLRKYSGFPCEKLSRSDCEEMFSFRSEGGIYEPNGGAEINLPIFCENLAEYLSVKGVEIYEYSPVTELLRTSTGFSATVADQKAVVRAKTVIDCRGLRQKISLLKCSTVYSSISSQKADFFGWKNRCILRSFGHSPLIACTTADDRIYMEGFSNKRILGNLSADISFNRLQTAADKMFFGISSKDGESANGSEKFYERVLSYSADGLPYMGRTPNDDKLYRIYASGRCGLTSAILAAKLISGAICNDKHALKRLSEYEPF